MEKLVGGYYLINLDVEVESSGTPKEITPSTSDEKLLYSLLSEPSKINKPILLKANVLNKDSSGSYLFIQFGLLINNDLIFGDFSESAYSSIAISIQDDKLIIIFIEL